MKHCLVLRAEKTSPGEEDPYAKVCDLYEDVWCTACWIAKALRDANYQPHFVPALQFEYINIQQLADHLKHPNDYSGSECCK